ncbi:hypothetical protein NPIL_393581 [Nephila pilipes]|uniref:SOCS box domain-containing protein n=1 Tax=Nephila pilipes TaxID=299642 RepID=A0A8X6T9E6_NEPPI|nr:hypothetical protein NPIL_393581 [Nephila pilipes]
MMNGLSIELDYLIHLGQEVEEIKMVERNRKFNESRVKCCHTVSEFKENALLPIELCGNNSERKSFVHENESFTFPRKCTVNDVIVFLLHFQCISSKKQKNLMAQCFRLVWRSKRTPYVKMQEIKTILEYYWINSKCKQCSEIFTSAYCSYGQNFPEIAWGSVTPRSLQHLSRFTIRKELMKHPDGMNKISKITLPPKIISYLWLKF